MSLCVVSVLRLCVVCHFVVRKMGVSVEKQAEKCFFFFFARTSNDEMKCEFDG